MGMAYLLAVPPERRNEGKGWKLKAGREKRLNKKIPPHSKKSKRQTLPWSAASQKGLRQNSKPLANTLTYESVFIILFV
jgi:hypothetical protein